MFFLFLFAVRAMFAKFVRLASGKWVIIGRMWMSFEDSRLNMEIHSHSLKSNQLWCLRSVISVLGRLRRQDHKF